MRIWIDADSCPRQVREIVARASQRKGIAAIFVANRAIPVTPAETVHLITVGPGEGSADDYIYGHSEATDLVVTRDIPLAARLIERDMRVLNDRGDLYTRENIRERLSVRDFMHELRANGLVPEKTKHFGQREIKRFADAFDRELSLLRRDFRP